MFKPETIPNESFHQQNQNIFDIYNIYRLLLSFILLTSYLFESNIAFLGAIDLTLFYKLIWSYLLFNILVLFRVFLPKKIAHEFTQYIVVIVIDIIFLAVLSYTCGGVVSGMTLLLIVPVAAGSILFQNKKTSTFLAAVGTISTFYTEFYLNFILARDNNNFFQAAMLGAFLFAISLLLQYLRGLIRRNELIAIEQAESIQSLEEMNYQIIQRMQTGIIVVDSENTILNANSSAQKLLLQDTITSLPEILLIQLKEWKLNMESTAMPFRISENSPQVQASFSFLHPDLDSNVLIFLEDYSLLTSRVQHMKLMSLGRLTASIAHEVRNPLGAISHASQLLGESETIVESERRLLEIIDTHSHRVNSIIENILQLSRNKSSAPDIIPLYDWLENFVNKLSNSYENDIKVQINIEPNDIAVRFNPGQLEQIMFNLCENGIRASRHQTQEYSICLKAHINPHNSCPVIDIIDDGAGIPTENHEKIFEPFFTTENTGTGLGLFICKEICEANQAQLSYRRIENKQTCFSIFFAHPDRNIA